MKNVDNSYWNDAIGELSFGKADSRWAMVWAAEECKELGGGMGGGRRGVSAVRMEL